MSFDEQAEAPKRKRTGLIEGVCGLVVVVVAGGVYALTSSGGSTSPGAQSVAAQSASPADLSTSAATSASASASVSASVSPSASDGLAMKMPTTAGNLTLMTNSEGNTVSQQLRQENASIPSSAIFGGYEKTGTSTYFGDLILLELSDGDADAYENLYTSSGAPSALGQIIGTTMSGYTTQSPGPNSAMACAAVNSMHVCEWIDATEYGTAGFPASVPLDQAAAYATALWKASE